MNLPNLITFSRLILTAVFIGGATMQSSFGHWLALVSFIVASASDFVDGYLARKLGLVTALGKLMDPLADKVLVSAAFVHLSQQGYAPVWMTVLIIGREFMVTGLRQIAVEAGHVMAADRLGKWKTVFQLTFCITCLLWLAIESVGFEDTVVHGFLRSLSSPEGWLQPASLWLALGLTTVSGCNYLWNSRTLFKNQASEG